MKKSMKGKPGFGRPTKYKPEYCEGIIKHFSGEKWEQFVKSERHTKHKNGTETVEREYGRQATDLPTIEGFARKIGVEDSTIVDWASEVWPDTYQIVALRGKYKHPDFHSAYNTAKQLQKEWLIDTGLKGLYPPASFIFVAKNITNMKDKVEADVTSKGKRVAGFTMVMPNSNGGLADNHKATT